MATSRIMERFSLSTSPNRDYSLAEGPVGGRTSKEERRRRWTIIGVTTTLVVLLALGGALGAVLTARKGQHHRRAEDAAEEIGQLISEHGHFPNGSFPVNVSSVRPGPWSMSPGQPNVTGLATMGVVVQSEGEYEVVEAGRLVHLYLKVNLNETILVGPPHGRDPVVPLIASIGVRFGQADRINLVSLYAEEQPGSGLSRVTPERTIMALYEFRVRMPDNLCSGRPDGCHFTTWRAYACARDGETCASSEQPLQLAVPCGAQCTYPSGSLCSEVLCRRCGEQASGGGHVPATGRFNLGLSSGSFQLVYRSKDQVPGRYLIRYEESNKVLFDSGCVDTDGTNRTALVAYAGSSGELRVDVEPNCRAIRLPPPSWSIAASCLYPCGTRRGRAVLLRAGAREVVAGSRVAMSKEAEAPPLTAYYCPEEGRPTVDVRWTLTLNTTSGKQPDWCQPLVKYGGTGSWDATPTETQGGDAKLEWRLRNDTAGGELRFRVVGSNPDEARVIKEIRNRTGLWYAEYVARAESGLKQFDQDGYPLPGAGGTGGFGVFPLSGQLRTCLPVWSWKQNVKVAVKRLELLATSSRDSMKFWRSLASRVAGKPVYVEERREAGCLFKDDTERVIEDAVALKRFKGDVNATTPDYCLWNMTAEHWAFFPNNDQGVNYVRTVCSLVQPAP